jgi:hypothetical protein
MVAVDGQNWRGRAGWTGLKRRGRRGEPSWDRFKALLGSDPHLYPSQRRNAPLKASSLDGEGYRPSW